MTSPTEIQFQASWAIREWDRSGMGLFDGLGVNLELDNINDGDGLPADVLRSSFDENSDPNEYFLDVFLRDVCKQYKLYEIVYNTRYLGPRNGSIAIVWSQLMFGQIPTVELLQKILRQRLFF